MTLTEWILFAGIVVTASGSLIGVIWSANRNRQTGKEANENDRVELLLNAYDMRIKSLESTVNELEADVKELKDQNESLKAQNAKQDRELERVKGIVRKWIGLVRHEWKQITDRPFPTVSIEEMELLDYPHVP